MLELCLRQCHRPETLYYPNVRSCRNRDTDKLQLVDHSTNSVSPRLPRICLKPLNQITEPLLALRISDLGGTGLQIVDDPLRLVSGRTGDIQFVGKLLYLVDVTRVECRRKK
jgi:hypothetical protein